jgi:hypothetical protein
MPVVCMLSAFFCFRGCLYGARIVCTCVCVCVYVYNCMPVLCMLPAQLRNMLLSKASPVLAGYALSTICQLLSCFLQLSAIGRACSSDFCSYREDVQTADTHTHLFFGLLCVSATVCVQSCLSAWALRRACKLPFLANPSMPWWKLICLSSRVPECDCSVDILFLFTKIQLL